MNTPSHLIFGAAAFAKPGAQAVTISALIGAFLPDVSLYVLAGWHLLVLETLPQVVFGELYFSERWQAIFAVDNSFILWGFAFALALWSRRAWAIALTGSGLLHLIFDFPLHNDDARRHFWPLTDWTFISPVSYWDRAHFGNIVAPLEVAATLILLVVLWRRFRRIWPRIVICIAAIFQVFPLSLRLIL